MIPFLNKQIIGSWFGISCYHILVLNWTRFQSFLELFFRQMSKNATPVADHSVCINVWTIYNAIFPPLLYFKIEDLTYHMLSEKKIRIYVSGIYSMDLPPNYVSEHLHHFNERISKGYSWYKFFFLLVAID